jgi:hypothetical protein
MQPERTQLCQLLFFFHFPSLYTGGSARRRCMEVDAGPDAAEAAWKETFESPMKH